MPEAPRVTLLISLAPGSIIDTDLIALRLHATGAGVLRVQVLLGDIADLIAAAMGESRNIEPRANARSLRRVA